MSVVHLVWSADDFAAEELTARILEQASDDAEITMLEAASGDVPGLDEALHAPSLFTTSRVVVVRGAERLSARGAEALATALAAGEPPGDVVVVAVSERQPATLTKALRSAETHTFARPRRAELVRLVERRMRRAGLRPGRSAAGALVDAVGANLRDLANAVEQLATRLSGSAEVTDADVAAHFSATAEQPVWALFDAIVDRDTARALGVLRRLIGAGNDPIPLMFAVVSQVRYLMRARSVLERDPSTSDGALAKAIGVSPGRAAVLRKQCGRLPWEWLVAVHGLCAEADVELKGGEDGAVLPPDIVLERLVAAAIDAA